MSRSRYQEKLFIGLDDVGPGFDIITNIGGDNGSNINFITKETGANITLRGRGSGYIEPLTGRESSDPIHLFVEHNSSHEALKVACNLAHDLIKTVKDDWYQLKQSRSSSRECAPWNRSDQKSPKQTYGDSSRRSSTSYERKDESKSSLLQTNSFLRVTEHRRHSSPSRSAQDVHRKDFRISDDRKLISSDHLKSSNRNTDIVRRLSPHRKSEFSSRSTLSDRLNSAQTDRNGCHQYKIGEKRRSFLLAYDEQKTPSQIELSDDEMPDDDFENEIDIKRIKTDSSNDRKSLKLMLKQKQWQFRKNARKNVNNSTMNFRFVTLTGTDIHCYRLKPCGYDKTEAFSLKITGVNKAAITHKDVDFIKSSVETAMTATKGIEISLKSIIDEHLVVVCRNRKTYNWLKNKVISLVNPDTKKPYAVRGIEEPPTHIPPFTLFAVWMSESKKHDEVLKLLNCNSGIDIGSFRIERSFKWDKGETFIFSVKPCGVKWLNSSGYRACCGMGTIFFFEVVEKKLAQTRIKCLPANQTSQTSVVNSKLDQNKKQSCQKSSCEDASSPFIVSITDQDFQVIDEASCGSNECQPDTETAKSQPDIETAKSQPDIETAKCQPDTETAKCQPEMETAKCQPDPETAKSQPDIETAKCQRDIETAKCQPDTKTAKYQPDIETAKCQPDIETAKCQPDTETAKCQPDIETAKCQPDTETANCQPDVETAKCQPDIETAKCQPDIETAKCQPDTETAKCQPDTETAKTESVCSDSSEVVATNDQVVSENV